MDWLIKIIVITITLFVFIKTFWLFLNSRQSLAKVSQKLPILFTGFAANIADTLGIGSFAVVVALNNRFRFVDDKLLPGTLNAHSVLPAMLQSLLFLHIIEVDIALLFSFVFASCIGGFLSGFLVSRLDKQSIRFVMTLGFSIIAVLIICNLLGLFPVAGSELSLSSSKFFAGMVAMFFAGMLPAIGAGLYAPILVILFFLGLSPLIAFPIMTTTGAIVQSCTAFAFVSKKEIAIKESLLMSLAGLVGVAIAVPFVSYVNPAFLSWLLLFIVLYNLFTMARAYYQERAMPIEA